MAHIFPPKAFKPQELPDPAALDSVIIPIAEKIWGKINEQDINAVSTGTFPLSVIDPLSGTGSDEGRLHQQVPQVPRGQPRLRCDHREPSVVRLRPEHGCD